MFSAVATTFIAQILPQPSTSGPTNASPSAVTARSILFASLAVTLFVAFIAVLGKQWILHYTRASTWGSIVDRGKERQVKFVGLQKWGLHYIMESLPVMLQFALLLFNVGLIVYLWNLDRSSANVILAVTCTGFAFYAGIATVATIWTECPFQTPLSVLLLKASPWAKETTTRVRAWPRRQYTTLLSQTEPAEGYPLTSLPKTSFGEETTPGRQVVGNARDEHYMKLSNPAFWSQDPLFTPPLPINTAASAGFWLIENSTDFSAATAVAAVFSEFQWPSHHPTTTALIRLRDTYLECFRGHKSDRLARLQALQSAAAYYVLYHARLIWNTAKGCEAEVEELPADLPPDLLLLHKDSEEWHGCDLFECLLRIKDRSAPMTSARFLSYIAPYWLCGDTDSSIKVRWSRLQFLDELIAVLESSRALGPGTLTDCVLCVGVAMDFPLHPENLIRVDKRYVLPLDMLRMVLIGDSDYLALTFKLVVEHIHDIALAGSDLYGPVVADALEILLTLVKHSTLPLVHAAWINELLETAAGGDMADEEFILLLKLSARRKEEGDFPTLGIDPFSLGRTATSEASTPDDTLFRAVVKAIQACDWLDDAVYGGLLAIRDIRRLGPSIFDDDALQMFHEAMNQGNPMRVRKSAYDAVLVMQDQWLRSPKLRQRLEDLGFFGQLYHVVIEMALSDCQQSFLMMIVILSEDMYWHSYLREDMDIWFPLRHEAPEHTARIVANVGGMPLAQFNSYISSPTDDLLRNLVVDEWAAVPGRQVSDLTADRLKPLAHVTEGFKELLFDDGCRRTVMDTVEQVLPGLELRREDGYTGPEDDVRDIINNLLAKLQIPPRRRLTFE